MRKDFVCVNFGSDKFKFARVKCLPNKREITDLVIKDIRDLSDSDISKVVRGSFDKVGAKKPNVTCVLSSRLLMTKNIEIPSRDSKEIQEIITLQSGRYTPYSREEIVVDYINIGVYRQNYTKVLLIIVPRKVIKRHFAILNGAGLEIEKISISPEAIGRIYPHTTRLKTEDAPISINHISDDSTDFTVILKNKIIFMRNFPIGMHNFLTEREKSKEKFTEEIKRSLESYQSEDIERTPVQIVLTGAIEEIGDIKSALDNTLHIPTEVVPYFNRFPIKRNVLNFVSTVKQISFLDVISPLFISDELAINLVPEEVKLKKRLEARGKEIIKMGILIMAVFVLVCGILMGNIHLKSTYLEKLTLKYRSTNQEAQGLEKDFSRMQIIRNYLSSRGYPLEVLSELYSVILPDIYLNNIKFSEKGLSIRGTSESMSTVFTFVSEMEKSKYFQNVKTKYTTKRKEGDKDLTDFQITCMFEGVK